MIVTPSKEAHPGEFVCSNELLKAGRRTKSKLATPDGKSSLFSITFPILLRACLQSILHAPSDSKKAPDSLLIY